MQQATQYARALDLATHGKAHAAQEQAVLRLTAMLVERGQRSLLVRVMRAYEHLSRRRRSGEVTIVRVAHKADLERHEEHIRADIAAVGGTDLARKDIVDHSAIGGYEVRAQGMSIDRTHKRRLVSLYEKLKKTP